VLEKAQGTILGAVATGAEGVGLYGYGMGYYGYRGEGVELGDPGLNGTGPGGLPLPADEQPGAAVSGSSVPQAEAGGNSQRRRRWRRARVSRD
jgi:hypothetical protein